MIMTNAKTVIKKHSGSPLATPRREIHIAIWRSVFCASLAIENGFKTGPTFFPASTSLAELLPPRPLCGLIGSLPLRLWLWHMTVVLLVGQEEGNNMVLSPSMANF